MITDFKRLSVLNQAQIDWLISKDVPPLALGSSRPAGDVLKLAKGSIGSDGRFDLSEGGTWHIAILVIATSPLTPIDIAVWQPKSGSVGSFYGSAFCFGEDNILNPGNYCFGNGLRVYRSPLGWLRSVRDGICIIRPEWAAFRLSSVPRLVAEDIQQGRLLQRAVTPRLPKVLVPETTGRLQ